PPSSHGRVNRQRKYKWKFAAIESRTLRIISRKNDLSQIKTSLQFSDNVSRRCSCSGTIGALASVILLFLNARPVVSERSEFRRSVIDKARRPTEATGSTIPITGDELVTK
ncbi:hypothetical protein, partial [Odoribacter laneus]|uniref:hypothetical protein n=1 Tax=Odoribacter laneus TaxID=626933 RepID=UPI003FEE76C1